MRIEVAKRSPETRPIGLEAVSQRVGYGDISTFRQLFKRKTGLSPSARPNRTPDISPMRRCISPALIQIKSFMCTGMNMGNLAPPERSRLSGLLDHRATAQPPREDAPSARDCRRSGVGLACPSIRTTPANDRG
ncbi:AraC family transcriptional regulator [Paraburkholderia sp. BL18I3N2]|uniref:AraC family transcriptional regulator n=1 Tax=Paraburkholderia sp. BL18I3N2 TaxID=1938799 RepID=UPI00280BE3FC|nr:AraC family transcriptional regulator [Paraburkholderia sp. BL18I3N2]